MRLHPFVTDVALTGATQALVLGANLAMVSLVSKWMGVAALGEFLLIKRVSSWLLMGTQLGLGVALPRQIAHTNEDAATRARQYFAAAFVSLVPLLAVVCTAAALVARPLAQLCFGSQDVSLVYALGWLLAGSGLQMLVFGYYRGLQQMRFANFVQLGGLVAIPLLALLVLKRFQSTALVVEGTGIGMAAISVVWAIPLLLKARDFAKHGVADARSLLSYGIVRVPADLANGALLTLGPVMVAHYSTKIELSYLLLGVTCLNMTSLAFWPVTMMLLAKISKLLAAGRLEDVKEYVQHLSSAVVQLSTLAMTQGIIFAAPLITWWLGSAYLPGTVVISILMLAIPGYVYYYSMRSVLDAAATVPHNTYNLLTALSFFCVMSLAVFLLAPPEWILTGVSAAMTATIWVLALTTARSMLKLKLIDSVAQANSMWIVGVMAVISLAVQAIVHFQTTKLGFALTETINIALAFVLLRKSKPEWMTFVGRVALSRG